jgi:hypothetical protein
MVFFPPKALLPGCATTAQVVSRNLIMRRFALLDYVFALNLTLVGSVGSLAAATPKPTSPPAVALEDYQIFAGSTHAHTQFTWSHGEQWEKAQANEEKKGGLRISPEGVQGPPAGAKPKAEWHGNQGEPADHFARAKAEHYDFYVTSDHSQEEALNPVSPTNPAWVKTRQQAAAATDRTFVALPGYEHSENDGPGGKGHINVINSAEYMNALAPGSDLRAFYAWVQRVPGVDGDPVVASFNHPSAHQYNDFADRDAGVTDVITLLEVINSNKNVHYAGFLAALDHGWKVSPVCGNDNHGFYGISRHTSRTFVLATSRTKSAILEAMKQRRTYASLDRNIQCRYSVNGAIMGATLDRPEALAFKIMISDPDTSNPQQKITKLDLVTDGGAVVETFEPTPAHAVTWTPTVRDTTHHYYFVRVWNAAGGDLAGADATKPVAWLAPVWTGR